MKRRKQAPLGAFVAFCSFLRAWERQQLCLLVLFCKRLACFDAPVKGIIVSKCGLLSTCAHMHPSKRPHYQATNLQHPQLLQHDFRTAFSSRPIEYHRI